MPRSRRVLALGTAGPVTRALIGVNVAFFILELATGGKLGFDLSSAFSSRLVAWGGLWPLKIAILSEYYRLITSMFLHGGLLHIGLNMYVLWILGSVEEPTFGPARFAAIYFISGLVAAATSYWLGPVSELGVGASGAIFGLLGAWVAFAFRRRDTAFGAAQLRWALLWIGINLFIGFRFSGIDNFAHMGGLVGGVAAGAAVEGAGPPNVRPIVRVAGLVGLVVVALVIVALRSLSLRAQFPQLLS
jgi:rhomboid protease GluP